MKAAAFALALLASGAAAAAEAQDRSQNSNELNASPVWQAPDPNGETLTHLSAPGPILIKTGPGWIGGVDVNTAATSGGSLTVYDGTDATGTVMGVIDTTKNGAGATGITPWQFKTGLYVVMAGTADVTIVSH